MNLSGLLSLLRELTAYRELLECLRRGKNPQALSLLRSARAMLVAALAQDLERPTVLLVARPEQANSLVEQLRCWLPERRVLRFSAPEALPYERVPWSAETVRERMSTLAALSGRRADLTAPVVVASARAIMSYTLPRREFLTRSRPLRVGQHIELGKTLAHWVEIGYEQVTLVEEPGTFSRRGGIVDIFPADAELPVRIELFGDEIDSLRLFDPATQRSQRRIERCIIPPAKEALPSLGPAAVQRLATLDDSPMHSLARAEYHADLTALAERRPFAGIEFYIPYLYSHPGTLLEYCREALLIVDDLGELGDAVLALEEQARDLHQSLLTSGEIPANLRCPHLTWKELAPIVRGRHPLQLGYETEAQNAPDSDTAVALQTCFAPGPRYGGQLRKVIAEWRDMRRAGHRLIIVTRQARRIAGLWGEDTRPVESITVPPPPGTLTLVQGTLEEGWSLLPYPDRPGTHLMTDAEIFGWRHPRPRRTRRRTAPPELSLADLNVGDYVVHEDFGIGIFGGLVKATIDGVRREYLRVEYAGGDAVYVPVHHADRLSRYVSSGDRPPTISRLGTAEWQRIKERVRKATQEIARELLALYSARQVVPGHAFSPDTEWQAELEASFPYVETEDQLRAIAEVKADMEKPRPMDRLICGDVGYGKTEVALRAAFKAVMDGKQVAVLVPTTVLAQQHYTTFRQRLAPFPVRVEMLSRFRTPREQRTVLNGLAKGEVDIVIGTHRLLSRDVEFKDLGLLIVDEEQRFGVAHKERLKKMRTEVDVLTMTATPIPRTLYMSLTGVRDMSTIDTPPEERLPIKTHVGEYDENIIRKAILREIDRGGQVYFVHNRVQGIEGVRQRLEQLVPEATFAVAHGQMPERELERVMMEFVAGRVDVLVCTTIIESGLDIPNVNTIIVDRADRLGLAQMYQLRGRVGRGANRAYAYFLHRRGSRMTEAARQRLQAILEAGGLGAGFNIAMRDLEIRGAGELLGTRQHGHIAAVGFNLYCRLLAQAVRELKGETPRQLTAGTAIELRPPERSVEVALPLDSSLPTDYVPDDALRLRLYRRLAGLSREEELDEIRDELADRFGPLPPSVQNLLYQLRIKSLALAAGVEAIVAERRELVIRGASLAELDRRALQRALGGNHGGIRVLLHEIRLPLDQKKAWQAMLTRVLKEIRRLRSPPDRAN